MVSSRVAAVNIEWETTWSVPLLDENRSIRVQTKTGQVILRHRLVKPSRVELILRQPLLEVGVGGKHQVVVVHREVWET